MIIHSAEFIKSAVKPEHFPPVVVPEYAFIGRSNVGKSSLINMLTNRKLLAKISATPGKTRTLNFFNINNQWNLIDMPGYGYAKTSKTIREEFPKIINDYFINRKSLIYTFILIDSRHKPLKADKDFIDLCCEMQLPFALVFTKIDKISASEKDSNFAAYKKYLLEIFEELPPYFFSSAEKAIGKSEILDFIEQQNKLYAAEIKKLK